MQYYKKNPNPSCSLIGFLLLIFGNNLVAQTAGFTFEKRNNCAPARVVFTNESSQGHGITYEWDFGNGAISHSAEMILEEVYTDPGTYLVVLSVIEGNDTAVATAEVNIFRGPVAQFNASQTEGCAPFEVSFHHQTEIGDAPIIKAFWDFRDGFTVVSDSPVHTYSQAGNYDVFLQVTDDNGCTDYIETTGLITVYPEPVISFSASDTHACESPLVVNFINHSVSSTALQYHWDFGNGTGSDSYNATAHYNTDGVYDVTLRSENELGCISSLTKESYIAVGRQEGYIYAVQGNNIRDEENDILCPGKTRFASTHAGSTDYTWHVKYNGMAFIREGPEFSYNLGDSGRFEVKLVVGRQSACPDSMELSFRVDHIIADFEMDPAYGCQLPVTVNLTGRSEHQVEQLWILPDGSEDTLADISFTITHELSHKELYSHTANQLRFPFKHFTTSINGCRDSIIKELRVILPVARFMPDLVAGCVPLEVTFSDSSRSAEPIQKWTWIINQLAFSQTSSVPFVHTFDQPGEFEVMLAIENSFGCIDTSYPITVKAGGRLNPDFTVVPEQVCFGGSIQLMDKTNLHDSIDFWHYSSPQLFNITGSENPTAAVLIFTDSTGHKSVRLEVGYNGCLSDTVIQQAFAVNPPAGSFHEIFSCDSPLVYTFIPDIPMTSSIEWNINDNVIHASDSVRYRFPSSGDYAVTLKAFNNVTSCSVSITKTIKVRKVTAGFLSELVVCYGDTAYFNARPSKDYITECYNEGFLWDFNDNTPRRRTFSEEFAHVYYTTGTFITELVVRADDGCQDTLQKSIQVVVPQGDVTTSINEGCASGLVVRFTKTSTDEFPTTWEWIYGDNAVDNTSASPVNHRYTSADSRVYWAGLSVRDIFGCSNDKFIPITLSKPHITFEADNNFICAGNQVSFSAPYNTFDSYLWDFGDGATSAVSHDHVYTEAGIYDVTLSASQNGCQDTVIKTQYISVEKADAGYSVNDSIFDCYPAQVLFTYNEGNNVAAGRWTFGDGNQSPGYRDSYQYTYSKPGIYNTFLWIRTPNNCQATHSKTISVTGPYATFNFEPRSICYGDPVAFSLTSSQNVSEMEWIFGDGETSTLASPVHQYKAKGVIHPALVVRHNACEVTLTYATLNVSNVTAAFDFPEGKTNFCLHEELQTINQSAGYQDITWTVNDILVVHDPVLTPFLLSSPGAMQISLEVTDAMGCADSLTKTIIVMPLPVFAILGDTSVCSGIASSLSINPVLPGWSVVWNPPEGLNSSSSFTPSLTIDSTRLYTAAVTDAYGCRSMNDITISVEQPPVISRIPLQDTAVFIGESIGLSAVSDNPDAVYSWSPEYRISCLNCSEPVIKPENNVTYIVTITDECFALTEEFPVEVIIDFYIETPGAFTPNGDDNNDIFIPETKNIREFKEFKIFNRWGNLVFETIRLDEGWDGSVNGKIQNMDTYAYYIRAVTSHGYETEKRGSFMLIR